MAGSESNNNHSNNSDSECFYLKMEDDNVQEEQSCSNSSEPELANVTWMAQPTLKAFQMHSFLLGLLVGLFVQFSTLGVNFLIISLWDKHILERSTGELVVLSLCWSACTSLMAILTLLSLRSVVTVALQSSLKSKEEKHTGSRRTAVNTNNNRILRNAIVHLECRFVCGALMGVCLAWTVTDVLLGINVQIMFSLVTMTIAMVWCELTIRYFATTQPQELDDENDDDDTTEETVVLLV